MPAFVLRIPCILLLAIPLASCVSAPHDAPPQDRAQERTQELAQDRGQADPDGPETDFTGRYDGSSFETAMGMRIEDDGTFGWGLSVGALDLAARGTWMQRGDTILFRSVPEPVRPVFEVLSVGRSTSEAMVEIVWAGSEQSFRYATITVDCGQGIRVRRNAVEGHWSPAAGECPEPVSLLVEEEMHDVASPALNLSGLGWSQGDTVRIAFQPNDLRLTSFTGLEGTLDGDMLTIEGWRWPLQLKKVD